MNPTISIVTISSNHKVRGDLLPEWIEHHKKFFDEVVVIRGDEDSDEFKDKNVKIYYKKWEEDWEWSNMALFFNYAIDMATSNYIVIMDLDWFINEKDCKRLRNSIWNMRAYEIGTLHKRNYNTFNTTYAKGDVYAVLNAKYKGDIMRGEAISTFTDLSYLVRKVRENDKGVPVGPRPSLAWKFSVEIQNYGVLFWTKEQYIANRRQYTNAYKKYFGKEHTDHHKPVETLINRHDTRQGIATNLTAHCEVIKKKISEATPEMFGYNWWGNL